MIYSEKYVKEIHKPALKGREGDFYVFIGHRAIMATPTLEIRAEKDALAIAEEYRRVIKLAFKKK